MALRNLGDILRLPALAERTAFIDLCAAHHPRLVTARELDGLIVAVARGLLARGVRPGDRVGIVSENRLENIASYLGVMRMGAVAVPVNFKLAVDTIAHIFRDSEIRLAFTDAARASLVPSGIEVINFDEAGPAGFDGRLDPGVFETFVPHEDDLAEILYTSGSTGLPKGVPLTHHGQLWAISKYLKSLADEQPRDVTVVVAPLYHMNALFNSTVALANRTTVISLPRFDPRLYLETVARYRCTVLSGVATMFAMMVREHDLVDTLDLSSVREVSVGSAPLTDALLGRVKQLFPTAEVRNGFGTTEAGPAVFGPHPQKIPVPPLSLGYPIADIDWKLVDGATPDEGVLALRTPALMQGYLNLPRVTAEKIHEGWYMTGDVMRRDGNGFFFFVGRNDDMFVCGGENIYPEELEKLLERHPDVAQAAVVSAPDDIKGHIPVAFIVPRSGSQVTSEEIIRYALAHGPAYAHPRIIVFSDQLRLAGTNKIDRTALKAEAARLSREAGRASEADLAPGRRSG